MNYKILEIDKDKSVIKIEVVFDDGEVYTKRMMSPTDSPEAITGAIEKWLKDYLPARKPKTELPKEVTDMVGVKVTTSLEAITAKITPIKETPISEEVA